jgi:RimJ/RimL family protein N-acetyltransferase
LSFVLRDLEASSLSNRELDALVELMEEKCREDDPDDPLPSRERILAYFTIPDERACASWWAAWQDSRIAGVAEYSRRTSDENRQLGEVHIHTALARRRGGLARLFLRSIVDRASRDGVTVLVGGTGDGDGRGFCQRLGAEAAIADEIVQLKLDEVALADVERQEASLAQRATTQEALELLCFTDSIPEQHLSGFSELVNSVKPPLGTYRVQKEHSTPESLAACYAADVARGSHFSVIFARAVASGKFVGSSEIAWDHETPTHVWQFRTAVHADFRRRGIAHWMKVSMLRRLLEGRTARVFRAHRPDVNEPIRRLNERLGFRLYQKFWKWQIEVDKVADYLKASAASH